MIKTCQVIINHESKVSNSLARSKRQGSNFDVNFEMNELVGEEKQELSFIKVGDPGPASMSERA